DLYTDQWRRMAEQHPDVVAGSTNKYQNWEVVDPEKWVPDGYACVRVDSRGCGRSPGRVDLWSAQEARDFSECIEWAARQPWSNGKVGANGISYYAMNQWQVAVLQPPHLAAICIWEGAADYYRDLSHHGGILCTFGRAWFPSQVVRVQPGRGTRGYRSRMNGDWVSGPPTLSEEELGANRNDFYEDCWKNPLASDGYWRSRMPDWSKVKVPLFSSANWGGQGLHPRGNFEGFVRAESEQKGLEGHGSGHWAHFYTDYSVGPHKKIFREFLEGQSPRVDEAAESAAPGSSSGRTLRRAGRERVAAGPHSVDTPLPESGRAKPRPRDADSRWPGELRGPRGRLDVPHPAARAGDRDQRAARRQALRLVGDGRRRPVPRRAALHPEHDRGDLPGRARPSHADRPGMAAGLASQARPQADTALPAVSHPRREAAAHAGTGVRARRGDLADLDRGAGRISSGADRARSRLRISRGTERWTRHARRRLHGRRAVSAQ